jgi:hypothetical protein
LINLNKKLFVSILFFLFVSSNETQGKVYKGGGYDYFKKAYNLEATSENKAVPLYYESLTRGLKKEYSLVALWRLKNIHKKRKEIDFEYLITRRILKYKWIKTLAKDKKELKEKFINLTGLSPYQVKIYYNGLAYYYTNEKVCQKHWTFIIENPTSNLFLINRILNLLQRIDRINNSFTSLKYLDKCKTYLKFKDYLFRKLELLYTMKKYTSALKLAGYIMYKVLAEYDEITEDLDSYDEIEEAIESQSNLLQLTPREKFQIFFLIGKIYQKRKKYRSAYMYFRLASNHSPDDISGRALASYMQFLLNHDYLAFKLFQWKEPQEEGLPALLYHVLNYRLNRNQKSRKYLQDRHDIIKERLRLKSNPLLKLAYKYSK